MLMVSWLNDEHLKEQLKECSRWFYLPVPVVLRAAFWWGRHQAGKYRTSIRFVSVQAKLSWSSADENICYLVKSELTQDSRLVRNKEVTPSSQSVIFKRGSTVWFLNWDGISEIAKPFSKAISELIWQSIPKIYSQRADWSNKEQLFHSLLGNRNTQKTHNTLWIKGIIMAKKRKKKKNSSSVWKNKVRLQKFFSDQAQNE